MTVDEAIAKYNKLANNDRTCHPEEAQQLAKWLEELKALRLQNHLGRDEALIAGRKEGYNKAIDDFAENLIRISDTLAVGNDNTRKYLILHFEEIAEQLKAGDAK